MQFSNDVDLKEQPTGWRAEAACSGLDTHLFFPNAEDDPVGVAIARQVCAACAVKEPCLQYAIESRQASGIWGGATPRERRRIRRRWLEMARRAG